VTNPIARRYATALFDVVRKINGVERTEQDLVALKALLTSNSELAAVFSSAAIPPQKKRAVVDALVAQSGVSAEVGRLLTLLADRDRLAMAGDVADAFADRLQQERRVVSADIVTAVPLESSRRDALAHALGKASGATIKMTERVDPNIIGGVVATVGGTVFDGSVTTQLEHMRRLLTS
jgi:F-type H+-transporting ATPase subunit delta